MKEKKGHEPNMIFYESQFMIINAIEFGVNGILLVVFSLKSSICVSL